MEFSLHKQKNEFEKEQELITAIKSKETSSNSLLFWNVIAR